MNSIEREKIAKTFSSFSESTRAGIIANMRKKGHKCDTEDEIYLAYSIVYSSGNLFVGFLGILFVIWIAYTLFTL